MSVARDFLKKVAQPAEKGRQLVRHFVFVSDPYEALQRSGGVPETLRHSRPSLFPAGSIPGVCSVQQRTNRICVLKPAPLFCFPLRLDTPLADGIGEAVEQSAAVVPTYAAIRDANAILERLARDQILPSRLKVALHMMPKMRSSPPATCVTRRGRRRPVFCGFLLLLPW